MRLRPAHLTLLAIALVPGALGVYVIAEGIFDRSYDNTIWNYLLLGVILLVIATGLVAFVISDARRQPPPR